MKHFLTLTCILLGLFTQLSAKEKVVEHPPFLAWSSNSIIVDKAILSDTATILHIKAFYRPNYWIKIASGSFLRGNDGELYHLRKGIGITPDQEFWMPESGEAEFKLVFPPLPAHVTSVDFSEGDFEGSYKIWGIQLKGKLPKLDIPKSMIATRPDKNAALPIPDFTYGKAILKGKIADYRKDMDPTAKVHITSPFRGANGSKEITIKEDGSFETDIDVVTTTPVFLAYQNSPVQILVAPGETTSVILNLRECTRSQSQLHKNDKPEGKKVYYNGYLAELQQELANSDAKAFISDFDQMMKDIAGKTPGEYKSYILSEAQKTKELINASQLSQSSRDLLLIDLAFNVVNNLFSTDYYLKQAHIMANNLKDEAAQKYFQESTITLPEDYFNVLKDFPVINTPQAVYSSGLSYPAMRLSSMPREKVIQMLGTDKGLLLDLQTPIKLYQQICDFTPLTETQKEELNQLAFPAYATLIEKENEKIVAQIELNRKKGGFNINEAGEVSNEDLFPSIISKFRGHTLLVDFWATWCGPCRMANKVMMPMKEELKNKDIVYIYIAGENSPKGTWENMIPDIHGEHFRVTDGQWRYLMDNFNIQGVPTYFVIDTEGNITFKTTGFPGEEKIKSELQKAMEKN